MSLTTDFMPALRTRSQEAPERETSSPPFSYTQNRQLSELTDMGSSTDIGEWQGGFNLVQHFQASQELRHRVWAALRAGSGGASPSSFGHLLALPRIRTDLQEPVRLLDFLAEKGVLKKQPVPHIHGKDWPELTRYKFAKFRYNFFPDEFLDREANI